MEPFTHRVIMMKKLQIFHRKSNKHDAVRYPIFIFFHLILLYLLIEIFSHGLLIKNFLKYGFSGNGWWFVFVWIFIAFLVLLLYIITKLAQLDKDEFLYLEGDELIYIHGKMKKRVKVKDIYEILILSGGLLPTRAIHFKTRNPQDVILFAEGYEHALRRWISHEELIKKGVEIYQILRKINPNMELKRIVPRKYRNTRNAVMERYENGEWVPEEIRPWWEK